MIGFRGQAELVVEVADGVVHPTASASYNLVIPPGFGEDRLADQIAARLASLEPRPLVALVSPDTVHGVDDYIAQLYAQWNATAELPSLRENIEADAALKRLLHRLPQGRVVVQIVKRFHRVLDSLNSFVLGSLRDAESSRKLRTVTISPFGYDDLKKRWEHAGHVLVASNYGDAHSVREVEPLSGQEIQGLYRADVGPPKHVVELAADLTGGYPEPFQAVIDEWVRKGEPDLGHGVRAGLRSVAVQRMRGLVRKVDLPDKQRYRDLIVDLHQGVDVDEALDALGHHPWSRILVRDRELRAEALGEAAVNATIDAAVSAQREGELPEVLLDRAGKLYERKQYAAVIQMVSAVERPNSPATLKLLHAHSRVMATLYADDASEPGVDTDWAKLQRAVVAARALLAASPLAGQSAKQLEGRYRELESLAQQIQRTTRRGSARIVDVLARLHEGVTDARTALLLLLLKLEAGHAMRGHAMACLSVLALPEQIFRVWALWSLDLDYNRAPIDADAVWRSAEGAWPHGPLTRPEPGAAFVSFESFAYFAIARLKERPGQAAPEDDFKMLTRSLSVLSIRRNAAHAVTFTSAHVRSQLFELIDRWFEALLAPCGAHPGFTRAELFAQVEPLPILDEDGSLRWLS